LPATSFNMVADSLIFLKTIIHIIDITLLWARLYFLLFSICCPGSCSGHNIVPSRSCWHAEFICSESSHIWAKWSAKRKWGYLRWAKKGERSILSSPRSTVCSTSDPERQTWRIPECATLL
jgi:hypothetical protein